MIRSLSIAVLTAAALTTGAAADVTVFMYSEYIHPDIPKEFEQATGIGCKIVVYEAQEDMLAKLKTGGSGQFDVVIATDVIIKQLIGLDVVQPLDASKIPNAKNVGKEFLAQAYDSTNQYSYPYFWGTVGLLYQKDKATGPVTWKWLFDSARQPGPFVIMDEARTTLGCTNLFLGKGINDREATTLKATGDALVAAKKSAKCLGFDGGVGAKNKVVSGEAVVAMVYNGDAVTAIKERAAEKDKPALDFAIPTEGSNIWVDCMLVTKQAPNKAGAHAFINYMLDAKVAAQNANHMHYATPVAAAMDGIAAEDKANPAIYPTAETKAKLQYLGDPGKDMRLLDAVWTKVKAQ